jgi:hypothetical protein
MKAPLFKRGMAVKRMLCGPGPLQSTEPGKVLRIDKRGVWLDNGEGNRPSGPFNPVTGWHPDDVFGTRQRIDPK